MGDEIVELAPFKIPCAGLKKLLAASVDKTDACLRVNHKNTGRYGIQDNFAIKGTAALFSWSCHLSFNVLIVKFADQRA